MSVRSWNWVWLYNQQSPNGIVIRRCKEFTYGYEGKGGTFCSRRKAAGKKNLNPDSGHVLTEKEDGN